jgi:hypothetical protein
MHIVLVYRLWILRSYIYMYRPTSTSTSLSLSLSIVLYLSLPSPRSLYIYRFVGVRSDVDQADYNMPHPGDGSQKHCLTVCSWQDASHRQGETLRHGSAGWRRRWIAAIYHHIHKRFEHDSESQPTEYCHQLMCHRSFGPHHG